MVPSDPTPTKQNRLILMYNKEEARGQSMQKVDSSERKESNDIRNGQLNPGTRDRSSEGKTKVIQNSQERVTLLAFFKTFVG